MQMLAFVCIPATVNVYRVCQSWHTCCTFECAHNKSFFNPTHANLSTCLAQLVLGSFHGVGTQFVAVSLVTLVKINIFFPACGF